MSDDQGEYEYISRAGSSQAAAGTLRPHPGNPSGVAEQFRAEWEEKGLHRRVWRGDFYRHLGTHWESEDVQDIMAEVNDELRFSHYEEWNAKKERMETRPCPT
jgi:hypothetical protein